MTTAENIDMINLLYKLNVFLNGIQNCILKDYKWCYFRFSKKMATVDLFYLV